MGQIIKRVEMLNKRNETLFLATLDIDSETAEGYCLEIGDGYTDGCTSFGHGKMAFTLANRLFDSVVYYANTIVERIGSERGEAFWEVFFEEFEDGWSTYDSNNDEVLFASTEEGPGEELMFKFIEKWHPDNQDSKFVVRCPHCNSRNMRFFESKGVQLVDGQRHHYTDTHTYVCKEPSCQKHFDVNFEMIPVAITKLA